MKVIVITGGGRHVGKTTLAFALADLLPGASAIKLGDHPKRGDKAALLLPLDTPFSELLKTIPKCPYLVLESGSILDDPSLTPDLVIYLPTGKGRVDKPGSERRRDKAHLVRGETDSKESPTLISKNLEVDLQIATEILRAIEALDLSSIG